MKKVAVDMDGVLADFHRSAIEIITKQYKIPLKPEEEIITWEMEYWFDASYEIMHDIFQTLMKERDGFWRLFPVVKGALWEFKRLVDFYETYIVTSPFWDSEFCLKEKAQWVEKNLPFFDIRNFIMTNKKHIIDADILIDDSEKNIREFVSVGKGRTGILMNNHFNFNRNVPDINMVSKVSSWNEIKDYL